MDLKFITNEGQKSPTDIFSVPVIVNKTNILGQTASLPTLLTWTNSGATPKMYFVTCYLTCTAVTVGTVLTAIAWTDEASNSNSLLLCGVVTTPGIGIQYPLTVCVGAGQTLTVYTTVTGVITYDVGATIIAI